MAQKLALPVKLPELETVEKQLEEIINETQGPAGEICSYMLKAGGKRLRPTLVLLSARCFADTAPPQAVTAAVAAELIHLASLIHDDIIDNAGSRHSKPSVNSRWGNKIAVLAGDNLFAKAFGLLSKSKLYNVLELMVEAIEDMCSGEIEQALDSFNAEQKEENYYRTISKKTGKLIAVCCQSGSLSSQAGEEHSLALREYGMNLGYAFQIADDILDFTGKVNVLGKPTGLDLAQGTLTLPMLNLLKNSRYSAWVKKVLQDKQFNETTRQAVVDALLESGALEEAKAVALAFSQSARSCLCKVPANIYRDTLEQLTLTAVERHK